MGKLIAVGLAAWAVFALLRWVLREVARRRAGGHVLGVVGVAIGAWLILAHEDQRPATPRSNSSSAGARERSTAPAPAPPKRPTPEQRDRLALTTIDEAPSSAFDAAEAPSPLADMLARAQRRRTAVPRDEVYATAHSEPSPKRRAKRRPGTTTRVSPGALADLDQDKPVKVRSYFRKDGTFVRAHKRRLPRS